MLLIPAIDLKNGQCVRLRQGRMDDDTVFSNQPLEVAKRWFDAGCKRLHLVDLDGAFAGEPKNAAIIKQICNNFATKELQLGGGIRNLKTIEFYLNLGIKYIIIGSQAVRDPEFLSLACKNFPGQIIAGIDAKDGKVATDGWAKISTYKAKDLAKDFASRGAAAIVYTNISHDGMLCGVDAQGTAKLAKKVNIPVIASGGVANIDDIKKLYKLRDSGIAGAILGRSLYEGTLDLQRAQAWLDKRQHRA